MKVEMEVLGAGLEDGDEVIGSAGGTGWGTTYVVGQPIVSQSIQNPPAGSLYWWRQVYGSTKLRIRREAALLTTQPVVNAVATIGRKVPDWPLTCPKCHRPQSAVLLFSSYDCRHGCFGRKVPDTGKAETWDFTWQGQHWRATKVDVVTAGHRGWFLSDDPQDKGSTQDAAEFRDNPDLFAIHTWNPQTGWVGSPGWVRTYDERGDGGSQWCIELTEVLP